jgi:hypothetical protein
MLFAAEHQFLGLGSLLPVSLPFFALRNAEYFASDVSAFLSVAYLLFSELVSHFAVESVDGLCSVLGVADDID